MSERLQLAKVARWTIALFIALLVIRYEARGFSQLFALQRRAEAANAEIGLPRGDVLLRDVPKARHVEHGQLFADPHYAGEVHWYPFFTPLLAGVTARVAHWSIGEAYLAAGLFLMGAGLISLGVLFWIVLGRIGLVVLGVALFAKWIEPLPACMYPVNAAQFALILHLAAAFALVHAVGERRMAAARRAAAGCGAALGLLLLLHGASFFCAFCVSLFALAYVTFALERTEGRMRALLQIGVAFGVPLLLFASLLFAPQLIHYRRIARPEVARLWLNVGVYHDAADLPSFLHLTLFPRAEAATAAVAAIPLLLHARWRRLVAVLGVALACATLQAHLGFVLHDRAHPRLAAVAHQLLFAPPHTFISTMHFLVTLGGLLLIGALYATALRMLAMIRIKWANRLVIDWAVQLCTMVTLLFLIARPPGEYWLPYEFWSRPTTAFAAEVAKKTNGGTVYMYKDFSLIWLAGVSPLFFPPDIETNPYAQDIRHRANDALADAVRRGDDRAADAILDKYGVVGFYVGSAGEDDVMRRCAGTATVSGPGALVLRARRPCGS